MRVSTVSRKASSSRPGLLPSAAAAALIPVLVVVLDAVLAGREVFDEGRPVAGVAGVARTAALVVAAGGLVVLIERLAAPPLAGFAPRPVFRPAWAGRAVAGMAGLSAALLGLFLVAPATFSGVGREDGLAENVTAALFFLAAGATAVATVRTRRRGAPGVVLLALVTLGLFVSGMEEISWGQRIVGFAGPEALTGANLQQETNLHNLATDATETVFYSAAAFGLVLLPYLAERLGLPRRMPWLGAAIGPSWLLAVTVPSLAFTYDMWDVVPVQLVFLAGVALLALAARRRDAAVLGSARLGYGLVALTVAVQIAFLAGGAGFVRLHDVTEHRELLTGLAFAVYGLAVAGRCGARVRSNDSSSSAEDGRANR